MVIEYEDLDDTIIKAEICETLKTQLGLHSMLRLNMIRLCNAGGGTQKATIYLTTEAVKKAIVVVKIRIVESCRLREHGFDLGDRSDVY